MAGDSAEGVEATKAKGVVEGAGGAAGGVGGQRGSPSVDIKEGLGEGRGGGGVLSTVK